MAAANSGRRPGSSIGALRLARGSRRRTALCALAAPALSIAVLAAATATPVQAQAVIGAGDDATTPARGQLRVRILGAFSTWSERYGPTGRREPLGAAYTLDTLGVAQFPGPLTSLQTALRGVTGSSQLGISLGTLDTRLRANVLTLPISAELGITRRVSIGAMLPLVRTRSAVSFVVNRGGVGGNIGINPARTTGSAAIAQNQRAVQQLTSAATRLDALLARCPAGSTDAACAPLATGRDAAVALSREAATVAQSIAAIYGTGTATPGSSYVPAAGSNAQQLVQARLLQIGERLRPYGVADTAAVAFPAAATQLASNATLQALVAGKGFGVGADSIGTRQLAGTGDTEVAATIKLLDTFGSDERARLTPRGLNVRSAVSVGWRLPTGSIDFPFELFDIGTGTGANALLLRSATDIVVSRRAWASVVARFVSPLADEQVMRITDVPEQPFPQAYREQRVHRQLGRELQLEVTPRAVLGDVFSVWGQWFLRSKQGDRYTGTFPIDASLTGTGAVTLDAATLGIDTEAREQRVGFGVTYSTMAASLRRRASLPLEVSWSHMQTVTGSGGPIPRQSTDALSIRVYTRVFGRR